MRTPSRLVNILPTGLRTWTRPRGPPQGATNAGHAAALLPIVGRSHISCGNNPIETWILK